MSIHDELIAKTLMAKPTTEEGYLNIDWDTRLITIPSTLTNIGVYNDKDTNRLYFRCPIEYGEFKIADFGLRVNYQNTGISTTKYDGDVYFVDDVESDGDYLTFSWLVGRHAYLEQGTTAFIVCCKVIDSDNNVVNELNTTIAILDVLEGLEVDVLPPEEYPDYLEEILKRCEAAEETAQEAKDAVQSAQDMANEAITKANEVEDKAIQGINVNGTAAEVKDHIAELTVAAEAPIEHIAVNSVEQPIVDKTVDLDIDKASYEEDTETVVLGDTTAGGGSIECIKVNGTAQPIQDSTVDISVPTKTSELENDSGFANVYVYEEHVATAVYGTATIPFEVTVPNGTPTAVIGFWLVAESPLPVVMAEPPMISGNTVSGRLAVSSTAQSDVDYIYISILCE